MSTVSSAPPNKPLLLRGCYFAHCRAMELQQTMHPKSKGYRSAKKEAKMGHCARAWWHSKEDDNKRKKNMGLVNLVGSADFTNRSFT